MTKFNAEIEEFLTKNDVGFHRDTDSLLLTESGLRVVPVKIAAFKEDAANFIKKLKNKYLDTSSQETLFIYEDRWRYAKEQTQQRVLLRIGKFKSIFARNCKVFSNISNINTSASLSSSVLPTTLNPSNLKNTEIGSSCYHPQSIGVAMESKMEMKVKKFIEQNHSLGYIKSPYIFALIHKENIVAAATFSKPIITIRIIKGSKQQFLSFEWTRYASLPNISVVGGMGKLLKAFITTATKSYIPHPAENSSNILLPIEIMSYSDNEWSSGEAYNKLGFKQVEGISPIPHYVNPLTWERVSERIAMKTKMLKKSEQEPEFIKIYNMGSRKWLLHIL